MQKTAIIFALSFIVLFRISMAQTDIPVADSLTIVKSEMEQLTRLQNSRIDSAKIANELKGLAKNTIAAKTDSLAAPLMDETLKGIDQTKKITSIRDSLLLTNYPMYKEYLGVLRDSTLIRNSLDKGEKRMENEIIKRTDDLSLMEEQNKHMNNVLDEHQKEMQSYRAYISDPINKEKLLKNTQFAGQKLMEHSAKLQEAQQQLAPLKQQYADVKNMADAMTKPKNALKELSTKERLIYGAQTDFSISPMLRLSITPTLAYRINKHLISGAGAGVRFNAGAIDSLHTDFLLKPGLNYQAFVQWGYVRGFFAHLLFEHNYKYGQASSLKTPEMSYSNWEPALMAGMGRMFKIKKKWKGQIQILYNFTYQHGGVYDSPWNVRTAFFRKGN